MPFKFGFSGEDIEGGEEAAPQENTQGFMEQDTQVTEEPQLHTFEQLIPQTRISYTSTDDDKIPRRDLFDVKYQLMSQDSLSSTDEILLGSSDLQKATYEGGLKVWECSFDLVKVLHDQLNSLKFGSMLELGCGTAVPSAFLFHHILRTNQTDVKLTLSDFNVSVLRLVTAPNMLLTWLSATNRTDQEGELEITDELVNEFNKDLEDRNIQLNFVSGSWSSQFVKLLEPTKYDLTLASETIYSLDSIGVFTDTLINCTNHTSLIAAKKVYFGVGGGVAEFEMELQKRGLQSDIVFEDKKGVGRSVLRLCK